MEKLKKDLEKIAEKIAYYSYKDIKIIIYDLFKLIVEQKLKKSSTVNDKECCHYLDISECLYQLNHKKNKK